MTTDVDVAALDPKALRARARAGRRAFACSPLSKFVRVMQDCMVEYHAARDAGVSRLDACKGIEAVLRAELPMRVTKFPSCPDCDGGGWAVTSCQHKRRCGRERCSWAEPAYEHTYAVYCICVAGEKLKQGHEKKLGGDDDLATIGKTKKKARGFTRFGR